MKRHFIILLLACIFAGCPQDNLPELSQANIRSQLKDNFKSAIEGMIKETKASTSNGLMGTITNIRRAFPNIDLGDSMPQDLDPAFLSEFLDKFFESDFAKALFSESNIISQNDTEIAYVIDRSLCDKLDGNQVGACKQFLEKNALELRINTQTAKTVELALWHGRIKNGVTTKQFAMSLMTSPNLVGSKSSLDGAKELLSEVSIAGFDFDHLKKCKGTASWQLRFKSDQAQSGCKNNARLCFMYNVDEDIDVEFEGDKEFSIKFAKSPKDKPTIEIFADADSAFKGFFNIGSFDGKLKGLDKDKKMQSGHLFVESSQFSVTLAEPQNVSDIRVLIENFTPGANPSLFEGFGKKVVVDLAHDARAIKKINFVMDAAKAMIDLSPFAIVVSLTDETEATCKTYESFKIASDDQGPTQLQFLSSISPTFSLRDLIPSFRLKKAPTYSSGTDGTPSDATPTQPTCTEDNLSAFSYWSNLKVSTTGCDKSGPIMIKDGSLEVSYNYHLNSDEEKTLTHKALKDQCLEM